MSNLGGKNLSPSRKKKVLEKILKAFAIPMQLDAGAFGSYEGNGNLIHGATYTFLLREQKHLGKLTSIIFSWSSSSWNFFKTHTIHLDYVKIRPMNVNNQKKQKMESKKFCDKLGQAIKSKQEVFLDECK
ncbi:hypothetical protein HNY73_010321 [Argiope bruennichi]|uniref:Uncharacterized protein n=1 Tax=Argiope bruennichi TaxID=94029 RepID=A0A8T0F6L9_ARGBR|nr:hypothetical protein HNY73_010321 [Argiope bruennichi]